MSRRPRGIDSYATDAGTRWRLRVELPPDSAGTRRRYAEGGFVTMQQARDRQKALQQAVDRGAVPVSDGMRLIEYLRLWLEGLDSKPTTIANYRGCVENYIGPRIGGIRLRDLQPEHLDALYRELERAGKRDGSGLAPKSVRHVHTTLHAALQQAAERGHLLRNVASLANPPTQKAARSKAERHKVWTDEQTGLFLRSIVDDDLATLWRLLVHTGLRRAEALGLCWDAVDLDAGRITVRRTVTNAGSQVVWQESAKTEAGERTISVTPTVCGFLREHRLAQLERRMLLGSGPAAATDPLFTRPDLSPLSPNAVSQRFTKLCDTLGLPRIGVHGLRHTYATRSVRAGVDYAVLSKRLGHANEAITLTLYRHVLEGEDMDAAMAAERRLEGL